jgi:site-specific DNA-cytosine methylase
LAEINTPINELMLYAQQFNPHFSNTEAVDLALECTSRAKHQGGTGALKPAPATSTLYQERVRFIQSMKDRLATAVPAAIQRKKELRVAELDEERLRLHYQEVSRDYRHSRTSLERSLIWPQKQAADSDWELAKDHLASLRRAKSTADAQVDHVERLLVKAEAAQDASSWARFCREDHTGTPTDIDPSPPADRLPPVTPSTSGNIIDMTPSPAAVITSTCPPDVPEATASHSTDGSTRWLSVFSPTKTGITTIAGRLKGSLDLFKRRCAQAKVPKDSYGMALVNSLKPEQYEDLTLDVGGTVVRFTDLETYELMEGCLIDTYDNEGERMLAQQRFGDLKRLRGQSPKEWGKFLRARATEAGHTTALDVIQAKFIGELAPPVKSFVHAHRLGSLPYDELVQRAQAAWEAIPPGSREGVKDSTADAAGRAGEPIPKRPKLSQVRSYLKGASESDKKLLLKDLRGGKDSEGGATATTSKCYGCNKTMAKEDLRGHKDTCIPSLEYEVKRRKEAGQPHDRLEMQLIKLKSKGEQSDAQKQLICILAVLWYKCTTSISRNAKVTPTQHTLPTAPANLAPNPSTPMPQTARVRTLDGRRQLTMAEVCCGIGGAKLGGDLAQQAGLLIDTVYAVDIDSRVCEAYKELHPNVHIVCAPMQHISVRTKLKEIRPDISVFTPPCTDYAGDGEMQEGLAAECTVHAAKIIVGANLGLSIIENVVQMLRSQAWRRATKLLVKKGYAIYIVKAKGTDFGMACARRRVYAVIVRANRYAREHLGIFGALINKIFSCYQPASVRSVLHCSENTFFWQPRSLLRRGVYPTDGPLPSMVRRHPGKPSPNYKAREADAGPAEAAKLLSL